MVALSVTIVIFKSSLRKMMKILLKVQNANFKMIVVGRLFYNNNNQV